MTTLRGTSCPLAYTPAARSPKSDYAPFRMCRLGSPENNSGNISGINNLYEACTKSIGENKGEKNGSSEKNQQRRVRNEMGRTPEQANSSPRGGKSHCNSASPERNPNDDNNDRNVACKPAIIGDWFCMSWKEKSFGYAMTTSWGAHQPHPSCFHYVQRLPWLSYVIEPRFNSCEFRGVNNEVALFPG